MKSNRKVILSVVSLLFFIIFIVIHVVTHKNVNYNTKLISVMKEKEEATVQDIFSFEFERAYVFNSEDCYLDGESFAQKYNLDISINQVKSGEADYVQRIVFVDESGAFIYEFKCNADEIILLEKGLIIYPGTKIERQSDAQEEPLTIKFKSLERYVSIPDFSYEEERKMYAAGMPGVKTSEFENTTEMKINFDNVVERAKNECTIEWDSVEVYLDTTKGVWRVTFSTEGVVGGDQNVYLSDNGKTVLIVYGE